MVLALLGPAWPGHPTSHGVEPGWLGPSLCAGAGAGAEPAGGDCGARYPDAQRVHNLTGVMLDTHPLHTAAGVHLHSAPQPLRR